MGIIALYNSSVEKQNIENPEDLAKQSTASGSAEEHLPALGKCGGRGVSML